jgi:hypothetical protein
MLKALFPEHPWSAERCHFPESWESGVKQKKFLESIAKSKGVSKLEDWHNVSPKVDYILGN